MALFVRPIDKRSLGQQLSFSLQAYVAHSAAGCRPHDHGTSTQGQDHRSKFRGLPLNFVFAPYNKTHRTILMKLHPNVLLSKSMCRIHDSATQTQDQGHTSRPCDLPFNSCLVHIS